MRAGRRRFLRVHQPVQFFDGARRALQYSTTEGNVALREAHAAGLRLAIATTTSNATPIIGYYHFTNPIHPLIFKLE